jgi:hypothetical protein
MQSSSEEQSSTGLSQRMVDRCSKPRLKGARMKRILRTLALTGIVTAAAVAGQAQAQAQVGFAVRVNPASVYPAPLYYNAAYVPPCPGVDFFWTPGYYARTAWVPGRWVHRDRFYVAHRDYRFDHRGWNYGRR